MYDILDVLFCWLRLIRLIRCVLDLNERTLSADFCTWRRYFCLISLMNEFLIDFFIAD
jgi:hypothetical protein